MVVDIMYPPHDGAANAIVQEFFFEANPLQQDTETE
jgi:hypothetical protein